MAIWIHQNGYANKVWADLRTVCPDPGLSISPSGIISYSRTMGGEGCAMVDFLQNKGTVIIRGEAPNWSTRPQLGKTLVDLFGVTVYDQYPNTKIVEIIYDASDCYGKGYVTVDMQGVLIEFPSDVLLFHEFVHASQMFDGTYQQNDPETSAIILENFYRAERGLPLRGGWAGGCRGSQSVNPSTGTGVSATTKVSSSVCAPLLMTIQSISAPICGPLLGFAPQGIGDSHVFSVSELRREGSYAIHVFNETTEIFSQVVVFYKRIGLDGVVFLKFENVKPNQLCTFVCGTCKNLESYVVGFYIGDDLVAKMPEQGNMTPELASKFRPSDGSPCIDEWVIY